MLQPKVNVLSTGTNTISVIDGTGDYDAISNPGGWGTPNASRISVVNILSTVTPLSKAEVSPSLLSAEDKINYLYQGGITINPGTNDDGVYTVNIRIGFANAALLSAGAGSFQFTLANASTIFATADGFTIDQINSSVYFQIDRTKPLTIIGGWVTTPLPVIISLPPTVYTLCAQFALISQSGYNCLVRDIANFAGTCQCCAGSDLDALLCRYAEWLSMGYKFNIEQDYAGANALAMKLQRDCVPIHGVCSPQGTQPNVPFVGNIPFIILQPVNQSVSPGAEVAFSVVANGTPPLYYQWYRNGIALPDGIGSTLTILNAQLSDTATFYVVVSNAYGSVQSQEVSLTVGASLQPVTITQQPQNQSAGIGGSASFTVAATGSPTITYQWYKNGVVIGGATAAILNLFNIQLSDAASYYCIVTNPVNSIQSNTAALALGVQVGWGWTANAIPTLTDIQNAQGSGSIASGSPIVADFRANTQFLTLFMFEPSTEPTKAKWYGSINNNGNIGDPNNDLFIIEGVSAFRVYYSVFPTLQTETKLQFLTANQQPS